VEPGDVVTLVGTSREFGRLGLQPATEQATATGPSLRRRMREALAAMSDAVDRPFRVAFAVLSALAIISIVILTSGYQEPDGTKMDARRRLLHLGDHRHRRVRRLLLP
jgi:hypothetical protein